MELQKAMETRRSIRSFNGQKLEKEKIQEMIQAAILAPSWKNSQVIRYYVVEDEKILSQVKETLPGFNQNSASQAPVLIISTIVLNRSGYERDGKPSNELGNGWGIYDCGLHDMNLLLKATELGVSTLVMGIRDAEKIKDILQIPADQAVISVIAAGYSDQKPEMPKRKSVEEIARFF